MSDTNKPYILVVEDEAPLVTLLHYNLEKQGFRVDEPRDGEEAMMRIDETRARPAAARLDAAHRVGHRGLPPAAPPPGHAQPADHHAHRPRRGDDRVRGLDTGADDYIIKPFPTRSFSPASAPCCAASARAGRRPSCNLTTSSSTAPPTG